MQMKDTIGKQEIFKLINANPGCFLGTCDGDAPRVRGILVYRADEDGIVFHTGKFKEMYQQLCKNPEVEICFTNNNVNDLVQVRVRGKVKPVEDMALKEEIVSKRDFLRPFVEKEGGYEGLAVFRLSGGRATVWSMALNFADKTWVTL